MKKIIIAVTFMLLPVLGHTATKCEPSPRGMCCWDTNVDGPFKPLSCF